MRPREFVLDNASVPKVTYAAHFLDSMANMLDDPQTQKLMTYRCLKTKPEHLKARKKDQQLWVPPVTNSNAKFDGTFSGIYTHKIKGTSRLETLPAKMSMVRFDGNKVRGMFNFGIGIGSFEGNINATQKLEFTWELGSDSGKGVLEIPATGKYSLVGTWGLGESSSDGGKWMMSEN